jgi:hypothetical protein
MVCEPQQKPGAATVLLFLAPKARIGDRRHISCHGSCVSLERMQLVLPKLRRDPDGLHRPRGNPPRLPLRF